MRDWQVNAYPLPKSKFKRVRRILGKFMWKRKPVLESKKVEAEIVRNNTEKKGGRCE